MKIIEQTLDDIQARLSPLDVTWMDETATQAIDLLRAIPRKSAYSREDISTLLEDNFNCGILCCRLFLALSKDAMELKLRQQLPAGGIGVTRFIQDQEAYLNALDELGLREAMVTIINHEPVWSDVLVERLRSGRGSAIQGQRRGRSLEDFAEAIVQEVFGEDYDTRVTFLGVGGKSAKCDFAIPDKERPRILIEVKGYGATGSKMTDIIGDLDAIIDAKRNDTILLFVTDGTTWRARLSDLRKIVERQNDGKLTRIYTTQMQEQFFEDLKTLKAEFLI